MADDQPPDRLYSRSQNLLLVIWGTAGLLVLAAFETAPPGTRIGIVGAVVGIALVGSLAAIGFLHQDGHVFGNAGIYPAGVAALVGAGTFVLTTMAVSSQQLTIAILGGVGAVIVTSAVTVRAAG